MAAGKYRILFAALIIALCWTSAVRSSVGFARIGEGKEVAQCSVVPRHVRGIHGEAAPGHRLSGLPGKVDIERSTASNCMCAGNPATGSFRAVHVWLNVA